MSCDFGSLCGFSVHFYTVSPCIGQVTHAFLTRPPLSPQSPHRSALTPSSARLACVKRAASVHPEPGSNSLLIVLSIDSSAYYLHYCFRVTQIFFEFRSKRSLVSAYLFFDFRCYTVWFSWSPTRSRECRSYSITASSSCQLFFSSFSMFFLS